MNRTHGMIKIQFPIQNIQSEKLLFYIFHIGSMKNQHPCIRPNGLEYNQIIFCTSGKGILIVDGNTYQITAGMGFLLRPGVAHEYYSTEEPWTTYWILFNGAGVEMLPLVFKTQTCKIFYLYNTEKILLEHQTLYALAENNALANKNAISASCYQFLLNLDDSITDIPIANNELNSARLENVIYFLENNFSTDITLENMARIAEITPQYLCRLFQNHFQMRPMEYVLILRMKEAKTLLLTDRKLSIKKIANTVGYHDTSYFCRMFKKHTGLTPSEFRVLSN